MPAHSAPADHRGDDHRDQQHRRGDAVAEAERSAPQAATPPMMICPSPPTLIRPARAGTTTASAASTSGVIRMKICSNDRGWVKVELQMSV